MFKQIPAVVLAGLLITAGKVPGQPTAQEKNHGHRGPETTNYFNVIVPPHPYDLILARPEAQSVSLSVLTYADLEGVVAYGSQPGAFTAETPVLRFKPGEPITLALGPLTANTRYHYTFRTRLAAAPAAAFIAGPEQSFQTARAPGSTFRFTLTADAHLDGHTSPAVYNQTLANIRADQPDFHLDLGNLFMTDKHATRAEAAAQYVAQRYYLGQIGATVPVLLALGVHDGEAARYDDGTPGSLADWSNALRRRYFPNPLPDMFYTGNATRPLENYYAWQWGDALLVVLDPYRYSIRQRGGDDGWSWSLGAGQYQWLAQTLEQSRAKYKLVFIHNLLAGDQASRGGVEIAGRGEWGGHNADGSDGFHAHRPGWALPVHELLRRHGVTAVFKAHDNFYARQELDGILYLMVPQPSFYGDNRIRDLTNYGYKQGVFLGNSGHVRVTVAPEQLTVEYVKSAPGAPVADRWVRAGH